MSPTSTTGRLPSSDPPTPSTKAATSRYSQPFPDQASPAEAPLAAALGSFRGREGAEGAPHLRSPLPPPVEAGRPRSPGAFSLSWGWGREAGLHREMGEPLGLGQWRPGEEGGCLCFGLFLLLRVRGGKRWLVFPLPSSHQNHPRAGWNCPRGQSDLHLLDWTWLFWEGEGWGSGGVVSACHSRGSLAT